MTGAFFELANARLASLATQDADDERAREHMADLVRTRITPGADPRAEWVDDDEREEAASLIEGGCLNVFECQNLSFRFVSMLSCRTFQAATVELDNQRYVPCDVCRWRDPEHRAALTARARAHAALVPGCRAAMEAER